MSYQKQRSIDLISNYPMDQQNAVDQLLVDEEMVLNAEATMITPNELEELLAAWSSVVKTPDELEDFLSAWESLPDDAFLIY